MSRVGGAPREFTEGCSNRVWSVDLPPRGLDILAGRQLADAPHYFWATAIEPADAIYIAGMRGFALHGLAGSGKSTTCRYISEHWCPPERPAKVLSFGRPLKEIAVIAFPCLTMEMLMDPEQKDRPVTGLGGHTPREVLQHLGDAFRFFLPPLLPKWEAMAPKQKLLTRLLLARGAEVPGDQRVLVDDMRKDDELDALKEKGFVSIHIVRGAAEAKEGAHHTEAGDLACDFTIVNDGTLEQLHRKIDAVMESCGCAPAADVAAIAHGITLDLRST